MIQLEMHIAGQLIGVKAVNRAIASNLMGVHIRALQQQLLQEHGDLVAGSSEEPVFFLSGIPSQVGTFTPLSSQEAHGHIIATLRHLENDNFLENGASDVPGRKTG